MRKRVFLFLIVIIFQFDVLMPVTGIEIMKKVFKRSEGKSLKMDLEMTLINRMGRKRVRVISVVRKSNKDSVKTLFMFKSPSDVKGVKFLSIDPISSLKESNRWLYLPSIKRVQRVSGSSRNDYFMGSDLTYNDLRKRRVDEENHKLVGTKTFDGHFCWIVESVSKSDKDIYGKRVSYIRKDVLIPIEAEYFSKTGKKIKLLKVKKLKEFDGIWIVEKLEMENLKKKHKTILEIKKVRLNVKINDSLFSPSRLERVKIR